MRTPCNTMSSKSSYKNIRFTDRFEKLVAVRGHRSLPNSRAVSIEESRILMGRLRAAIGEIASDDTIETVLTHNPQVIRTVDREDGKEPAFLAYLPLNKDGLVALQQGRLDRLSPDTRYLTRADEQAVALYVWCVYSPGNFVPAIAAIAAHFETIAPDGVPLFASAATAPSARLFASLGFTQARELYPLAEADVLVVLRAADEPLAAALPSPALTTRVSRTIEDVMKVFSIRAATYMNEQACPYDEEFDGNDFCAAHILGEIDGEPGGCVRVRFFGDFVKIERLAVRPEFRSTRLAMKLARAAFDYARAKGFRKAYGHSRHDLVRFWSRFGFQPIAGRPTFEFSDVTYVEIEADIAPANNVIRIGRPPLEMIRPEGAWDVPGPLDRSASRGSRGENVARRAANG